MKNKYGVDVEAGERTVRPADKVAAEALTVWETDPARRLIRLEIPELTMSEEWEPAVDLITSLHIKVRRADCGLGCKCAAEVKLA